MSSLTAMAQGGFTTITGTITDPNGLPYDCGTISAVLVVPGGTSPTLNGVGFSGSMSPVGLGCSTTPGTGPSGSFSFRVGDNGAILPANTQWRFTVNIAPGVPPPAGFGPRSFVVTTAINCSTNTPATCTSNTIDLSTILSGSALALARVSSSSGTASTPVNLVLAGDSQTRGGTPGSAPLTNPIVPYNPLLFVTNKGLDGDTVANMITEGPTVIDTAFVTGAVNVLHVWAGTNDFCNAGTSDGATTVFANLKTYIAARKAVGWKVVVATMISRTGTNPVGGETCDTDATNYNALIRANWPTFADGINDFGGNTNLAPPGTFSNTTFFVADGIHPNTFSVSNILGPTVYNSVAALTGISGNAAIAVVHTMPAGTSNNVTSTATAAVATTSGNTLVCHTRIPTTSSAPGIIDTAGNSFTSLPVHTANATNFQWWYVKNITGNQTDVITLSWTTASTFSGLFCWELAGIDRLNPVDYDQGFASGASAATATSSSYASTTTNTIALVVDDVNAINETFTVGSGHVLDSAGFPAGAGNLYAGAEHKLVSAAQTGIVSTMGQSPNGAWQIDAAVFRGASQPQSIPNIANCNVNSAGPAACGAAVTGVVVVPTTTAAYSVNTSAVTQNTRIEVWPITDATGVAGAPTCNAPPTPFIGYESARVPGTSFTFTLPSTAGTSCWGFRISPN